MSALVTVLFIAGRQLWAKKGLNGTAVLGVMLGVIVLITVNAMMQGFEQKFLSTILKANPHVTVRDKELRASSALAARGANKPLVVQIDHERPSTRGRSISRPREIVRELTKTPGVVAASASIVGSALLTLGTQEQPIELRGIDPALQDRVTPITPDVAQGSFSKLVSDPQGLVLGSGVARRLGAHVGDLVACHGGPSGVTMELEVVGIYDSGVPPIDDVRTFVRLRTAQAVLGEPDIVDRIEVRLEDPAAAIGTARRVGDALGYEAKSWQEENKNLLALLEEQDGIIDFVIGAILAVGGFGILAIQIMIVIQKTKDIAILRSYGYRRHEILVLFLVQGLIVAFVGAIVGDVVGHFAVVGLSHLKFHEEDFVKSDTFLVYDDPSAYVYGVVFALIVAVTASILPALRASRIEPVDVLRGLIG